MHRHFLIACSFLLSGCAEALQTDAEFAMPVKVTTDFACLPVVLAGIRTGDVLLYEGLPSQFWEPQLRERELREKQTVEIHGYPVYEEFVTLEESDSERLTAIISTVGSYRKYRSGKQCGDDSPDVCLEWTSTDGTTHALISLECGEVTFFGPKGELHCDFSPKTAQQLSQLLHPYTNDRRKIEPRL